MPLLGTAARLVATALDTARHTYDALAERGEVVLARRGATAEPNLPDAKPPAVLAHDELPLEDYDHLTLGALRSRLPRLDPVALRQLRDYERAHANRLPVMTLLDNRLAKVTAGSS